MTDDFSSLFAALDLTTTDWLRIFNAMASQPSVQREFSDVTIEYQLGSLPSNVAYEESGYETADKLLVMPPVLRLAVLEVVERFWGGKWDGYGSYAQILARIGVPVSDGSSHESLEAGRVRKDLEARFGSLDDLTAWHREVPAEIG